jgi:DNA (cytosine-5)-methyltransferase 1
MNNRFYEQAFETFKNNEVKNGNIIDAYNKKVIKNGISPTLTTRPEGFKTAILPIQDLRIRKLTPKECFRLMGVRDEDFEKCAKNQSNASLYHLAGDSIVVDVLCHIFNQFFKDS